MTKELEGTKRAQRPDARETDRLWQQKKHSEKAEWINEMTKELEGLEEGPTTGCKRNRSIMATKET